MWGESELTLNSALLQALKSEAGQACDVGPGLLRHASPLWPRGETPSTHQRREEPGSETHATPQEEDFKAVIF